MKTEQIAALVERARAGDPWAWDELVDEFSMLVWSVIRRFRLGDAAAADAAQSTWLRLVEHLDRIRQPERLAGWLRTTATHECLEVLRAAGRERPVDYQELHPRVEASWLPAGNADGPDIDVLRNEQLALLRLAIRELPDNQRRLLELLTATPSLSYREVSARLDMPVGSIGPTRARILDRLREQLEACGLYDPVLS